MLLVGMFRCWIKERLFPEIVSLLAHGSSATPSTVLAIPAMSTLAFLCRNVNADNWTDTMLCHCLEHAGLLLLDQF